MGPKEWKDAQLRDPAPSVIYKLLANRTLSHRKPHSKDDPEVKSYLHQKARLKLRNGVLYRQINTDQRPDRNSLQLCLPRDYRKEALEECHDNVGHFGVDRTLDLLRDRFYWPYMLEDTKEHVRSCKRCQMAREDNNWHHSSLTMPVLQWN